ncbi:MAG: hypothetical protein HC844_15820 [Tabrizicola sp.]|nr:hypothetical protein [Tabrizicola sp.]
MSNPESFIDEVTEEVRRDRLFLLFRKYGWIGGVLVAGIVGGAAWNEWSNARDAARAQAFGDAVIDAMDLGTPDERREGLAAVPADGAQTALLQLILATDPVDGKEASLAALEKVAADETLVPRYRDLAVLRRVIIVGDSLPLAERRAALQQIAAAGRPYRALAEEQLAILLIEEKKNDEAIAALSSLMQDQDASPALRGRAGQIITALGGTPPQSTTGG